MNHRLTAQGLCKRYQRRQVVDAVDLNVASGEVVGLLGPNGAGKTTSFYMVVGLVRPDGGRVLARRRGYHRACPCTSGRAWGSAICRRSLGVPQADGGRESAGHSRNRRARSGAAAQRKDHLLEEFGLDHIARSYGYSLSGGERRRVEIARALISNRVSFCSMSRLPVSTRIAVRDIQDMIVPLKERGIGVLISDHNVRETLGVCDRAYILNEGRILEEGDPDTIAASRRRGRSISETNSGSSGERNHGPGNAPTTQAEPAAGDDPPAAAGHQASAAFAHGAAGRGARRTRGEPGPRGRPGDVDEQAELGELAGEVEGADSGEAVVEEVREVAGDRETFGDIDWHTYLESYNLGGTTADNYEDDEDRPSYENLLTRKPSLPDHLLWQLKLSTIEGRDRLVAEEIIGNLDDDGYLQASLEEIAVQTESAAARVERVLRAVQEFDPPGIAARTLQECLLRQVERWGCREPWSKRCCASMSRTWRAVATRRSPGTCRCRSMRCWRPPR